MTPLTRESHLGAVRLDDEDIATFKIAQGYYQVRIKIVANVAMAGSPHVAENDDRSPRMVGADTPHENIQELDRSRKQVIVTA